MSVVLTMRASTKCVFFLLGTFCFIIFIFFYSQHSYLNNDSEQTVGGSIEFPGHDQVDWSLTSAGEQEEEQIEAACSLKKAVRNDVLLREKFRFYVSVLQWAGSFSKPAWERLKNREPPYGWKGLPVNGDCELAIYSDIQSRSSSTESTMLFYSSPERTNQMRLLRWPPKFSYTRGAHPIDQNLPGDHGVLTVVRSTLSLLNSSHLIERGSPARCVRCAVVGNGGILRGSRQGRNIDSHDFVFRVNGAVIKGFEEDVGTKISFYGFTTNTMKNALSWYQTDGFTSVPQSPEIKYIFIPSNLRDYVMIAAAVQGQTVDSGRDKGDRPWQYFGHKPPENFKILHPGFIFYVTHSFLQSRLLTNVRTRHLYMPSTGALMLLTALHTCDQVSAYGFITRNYAEFSDHYYDSIRRPLRFFANHDLQMESRLWETLHRRRVIRLYQRKGGS